MKQLQALCPMTQYACLLLGRAQRCRVVLSVAVQIIVELMSCSKLHEAVAGRVADTAVQMLL